MCTMLPGIQLAASAEDSAKVTDLKTDNLVNPLGIDNPKPSFSYIVDTDGKNKSQSAYKIVVLNEASNEVVWDSDKVESNQTYDIVYAGDRLESHTKYKWNVEVWDENNQYIGKSGDAYFETAFMSEDEWEAEWISYPLSDADASGITLDGANWIWDRGGAEFSKAPQGDMYFRKSVDIKKDVKKAYLAFTADDNADAYLNGAKIASVPDKTDAWQTGSFTDVTEKLFSGGNLLAFRVTNTSEGYAGLIVKLAVTYQDNTTEEFVSDSSYKCSKTALGQWYSSGYDDASWSSPDQSVAYGGDPWQKKVLFDQDDKDRAARIFRKDFKAEGEIVSARAYIAGAGLFEAQINGEPVTDSVLNPAHTDYNKSVLYCTYDVTDLLKNGGNAVSVMLGNGFYYSNCPGWNWSSASWRTPPQLKMEIHITYENGTTEKICTDKTFKTTADGPITENDIYYGETYDARKELGEYSKSGYDDSLWTAAVNNSKQPEGRLKAQTMEPIKKTKTIGTTVEKKNGFSLIKTDVMMTGWLKVELNEPAGTEIVFTYGEKIDNNGAVQTKSEGGRNTQTDTYICKGVPGETYEPHFSYKGFNYVQADGLTNDIKPEDITAYQLSNDVELTGSFESSDELVNTMHENVIRAILNNFQGKPTDTPYLEKNGWLGDANVALEMFNYNFGMDAFMTKFIEDMQDAQRTDGNIPVLVPIYEWGTQNAPVWNSIYIFAVKELYDTYGNKSYIEQQYDSMKRLADLYITRSRQENWVWGQGELSDWVSPLGSENLNYDEEPAEGGAICTMGYVYGALNVMTEFAQLLGKPDDAAYYKDAMANIYDAFNRRFYRENSGYYDTGYWNAGKAHRRTRYRQTSNIVPLVFGLVPQENIDTVVQNLVKDIKQKEYHLDTGVVGTKYILPLLSEYGYSDVAYKILTQTTYPSWGYWIVERGATTTHEMWESTARSLDHYFLGTYDQWLYEGIGGIKNVSNGYETFDYEPQLSKSIEWAEITLKTVRGELKTSRKYNEDSTITLSITVPFGSTANVALPFNSLSYVSADDKDITLSVKDGKVTTVLGSGTYTFTCKYIDGFETLDGKTYLYEDGKLLKSQITAVGGYNYATDKDGVVITDSWAEFDGREYYFGGSGIMAANEFIGESYVGADGIKVKDCLVTVNQYTYGFDASGKMIKNSWSVFSGKQYYFNAEGVMQKNKIIGDYYAGADGARAASIIVTADGKNYYGFGSDFKMIKGRWALIAGKYYRFASNGIMYKNTVVDGYYVGGDGARVLSGTVSAGGKTYVVGSDGKLKAVGPTADGRYIKPNGAYAAKELIGGKYYKANGCMAKNETYTIGGKTYAALANGSRAGGTKIIKLGRKKVYIKKGVVYKSRKAYRKIKYKSKYYIINKSGNVVDSRKNKVYKTSSGYFAADKNGMVIRPKKTKRYKISGRYYILSAKSGRIITNKKAYKSGRTKYRISKKGIAKPIRKK